MPAWPQLRPELKRLRAYHPDDAPARVLLDNKESPFAPPAAFTKRAQALLGRAALNRYPEPGAPALRRAAARAYGVPPAAVLLGNGSDELIQMLVAAFAGARRACLLPTPTFSMYRISALGQGLRVLEEPLGPGFELSDAFLERARREKPALIFLARPNSPTGNAFDRKRVEALLKLRGSVVVLDEAYAEFAGESFLPRLRRHPNLVVLRTLSKSWGLAGLRVGFLFAHPGLVAELEKLRLPYNVDRLAQALAGLALSMPGPFKAQRARILANRARLAAVLGAVPGMTVLPSRANFVTVRHPRAAALNRAWLKAGIRVRTLFSVPGLEDALQVTVGSQDEIRALGRATERFFRS